MDPFTLNKSARNLKDRYPTLSQLKEFYKAADPSEVLGACRAWLTEGIPWAFSNEPLLFEKVRELIANEIRIEPADIKLIGSARMGYSMNPTKVGNQFSDTSDLDLAVVSAEYFSRCEQDFRKFKYDFENNIITPDNSEDARWWPEIINDIDNQSQNRGFVDICLIPKNSRYLNAQTAINACSTVTRKLKITSFGPTVRKCSIRVYRDTKSFIKQNRINFRSFLDKIV